MEITICGHKRALLLMRDNPYQLNILMLSGPDNFFGVENSRLIPELARDCKRIAFHDIDFPRPGYIPPSREQVEEGLAWAKGREKIIVACQMGISRSSAMAYLIACADKNDPEQALSVLDKAIHSPNMMVIRHGADILGDPNIVSIVSNWKQAAEGSRNGWGDIECTDPTR